MATSSTSNARLRVAVLVDLEWSETAGGHVRFWQRVLKAAAHTRADLDLTVYAQGRAGTLPVADHARVVLLPPVLSSRWIRHLVRQPDYTDLASYHRDLARRLCEHDVVHTTDAFFCHAKTATRVCAERNLPLVSSLHTDTPGYTRRYLGDSLRRWLGHGWFGDLLVDRLALPARMQRHMQGQLRRHLAVCRHVWLDPASLGGNPRELLTDPDARTGIGGLPVSHSTLRRGLDRTHFSPTRADRARLHDQFGIDPTLPVIVAAGRLSPGKRVLLLARAARRLIDAGQALSVVFAGSGEQRSDIAQVLGRHAVFAGQLDEHSLGWLYASSDLLVHASDIELFPNVVAEALACGLPAVVAPGGGGRLFSHQDTACAQDPPAVIVDDDAPQSWATAIGALLADPARGERLRAAGLRFVQQAVPDWHDILTQDLLPHWRMVAQRARSSARLGSSNEAAADT
ncbi:MAG: glycosyltransferase [Gammaproteobacteria bacterium]|nr:glycosyltransferase [Gammaproteobacteria bacterium]